MAGRAIVDRNRPVKEGSGNNFGMTTYAEAFLYGPNELPAVCIVATLTSILPIRCVRNVELVGLGSRRFDRRLQA